MLNSKKTITPAMLETKIPWYQAELTTETQSGAILEILAWLKSIHPRSISNKVWLECQTALVEGFDNVIRHAHKNLPTETPILIQLSIYTEAIKIQIWDHGEPYDLETVLKQTPEKVDVTAEHGRGLLLMRRLTNYLAYSRSPDNRNCLQMIRLLNQF